MSIAIDPVAGGVRFRLKVVPSSARDAVAGLLGDALKIQVGAPAEKGRANAAAEAVLAKALDIKRSDVQVIAGHTNPRKTVFVRGLTAEGIRRRLGLSS
jgi:hypothetical protein